MAVDNPDVIDIVSEEPSGSFVLIISDHLDWLDSISHQRMLQVKINRYLAFVRSGQILDYWPEALGREVVIRVVAKCEPDAAGLQFLERMEKALAQAGFQFLWKRFNGAEGSGYGTGSGGPA